MSVRAPNKGSLLRLLSMSTMTLYTNVTSRYLRLSFASIMSFNKVRICYKIYCKISISKFTVSLKSKLYYNVLFHRARNQSPWIQCKAICTNSSPLGHPRRWIFQRKKITYALPSGRGVGLRYWAVHLAWSGPQSIVRVTKSLQNYSGSTTSEDERPHACSGKKRNLPPPYWVFQLV